MLGQAKGTRANNGCQSTPWFTSHLQEVTVCDVTWTRPDFSPIPRNWLMFHWKMRSIHKTGQQKHWRSNSNHPKADQSQNTSNSIVAGAHRKQWGHILEDQQRRNVGKLHGSVRKGPPPHLATWKPEPRGYPGFDHGTGDMFTRNVGSFGRDCPRYTNHNQWSKWWLTSYCGWLRNPAPV